MSATPFIGEIQLFAGTFAPEGWLFCAGQLLPIQSNTALFSLLGTMYGGDGKQTFALPDLRTRAVVCAGQGPGLTPRQVGEQSGQEQVVLTSAELPMHVHAATVQTSWTCTAQTTQGTSAIPSDGATFAAAYNTRYSAQISWYVPSSSTNLTELGGVTAQGMGTAQATGGQTGHENMQPWLAMSYIIATQGIWPSRP